MNRLRIRRINQRNWNKWAPVILQTMHSVFHKNIWWTSKEFQESLRKEQCIARLATIDNQFVGFAWGFAVKPQKALENTDSNCRVMHLFHLFIAPKFQGAGYSFRMLKDFASVAKKRGYSKLTGIVKPGPSLTNRRKLNTKELEVKENYFNTRQRYIFCATDLN